MLWWLTFRMDKHQTRRNTHPGHKWLGVHELDCRMHHSTDTLQSRPQSLQIFCHHVIHHQIVTYPLSWDTWCCIPPRLQPRCTILTPVLTADSTSVPNRIRLRQSSWWTVYWTIEIYCRFYLSKLFKVYLCPQMEQISMLCYVYSMKTINCRAVCGRMISAVRSASVVICFASMPGLWLCGIKRLQFQKIF